MITEAKSTGNYGARQEILYGPERAVTLLFGQSDLPNCGRAGPLS